MQSSWVSNCRKFFTESRVLGAFLIKTGTEGTDTDKPTSQELNFRTESWRFWCSEQSFSLQPLGMLPVSSVVQLHPRVGQQGQLRKETLWWCWKQNWFFHCILMTYIILLGTWLTLDPPSCSWSWPNLKSFHCLPWLWFSFITSHWQKMCFFPAHLMLDKERYSGT